MSAIPIKDLLNYINEARTNPKKFSEYIKKQLDSFIDNNSLPLKPHCTYSTFEGKAGWKEAYDWMRNAEPLPAYELNEGLNLAAMDHALDMKANKFFDHQSSNGMSFSERIERRCGKSHGYLAENLGIDFDIQGRNHALQTILGLVIDDGMSNKGHRKNIMSEKYRYCGIYAIRVDDRYETCIKFHSENLKVIDSSPYPLLGKSLPKQLKKDSFEEEMQKQFSKMKLDRNKGFEGFDDDWKPSNISTTKPTGEKYVKSKSTSTKTSTVNGKTTKVTTVKIIYSDGTTEEQVNEETF